MQSSRRPATTSVYLLIAVLSFTACGSSISVSFGGDGIEGSGELVTQEFDLRDFDSLDISSAFDVEVVVGDVFMVEVTADDNLVEKLDIELDDDDLEIGLKDGTSIRAATLRATVQMPTLSAIEVSGASSATIDGIAGPEVRVDASGASRLDVTGTASSITVDASGASEVDLRLDQVSMANVDLSGASSLELRSADIVTGELSGASELTVPDATITNDIDLSGASSISRN